MPGGSVRLLTDSRDDGLLVHPAELRAGRTGEQAAEEKSHESI